MLYNYLQYNEMNESRQLQEGTAVNELVLDFDPKTKETILEVHKDLVAKLKPHQVRNISQMFVLNVYTQITVL
jgi:transcriptional regulator ATRX